MQLRDDEEVFEVGFAETGSEVSSAFTMLGDAWGVGGTGGIEVGAGTEVIGIVLALSAAIKKEVCIFFV